MISMIWAMDESNLIGSNNSMPWHIKEDLIYYKETTKDNIVVMGYNTYMSLEGFYRKRGFPYKKTLVLTHKSLDDPRISTISSIDEILSINEDIFICGGKNVYKQLYPYADKLYISYIKGIHEGDTYIDFVNFDEWNLEYVRESELVKYTIYNRKK